MQNENIPLMNLPEQSGEYKIIQFESGIKTYLRFGRRPGQYGDFHQFILKSFAEEIGVECTKIQGHNDLIDALPEDIPYRMSGAGMCHVNLEERTAFFSGSSRDYKTGVNQDHLQKLRTEFPEWQIK